MPSIRDFIYLDLPRLRSFASQLFEGVPESRTHANSREADVGGEVRGRVPFLIEAAASTKGVLSASSTVTATVHHQLVSEVIAGLRDQGFLWESADAETAPDGAFVLLSGQIQISDPESLRSTVAQMPDISRHLQALTTPDSAPAPTMADRRAHRVTNRPVPVTKAKADALSAILTMFTGGTVRLRLLDDREPLATAVVERDKFVEDLDRLVRRHGYLTSGRWETLAQVNSTVETEFYAPEGQTLMDVLEREMIAPMKVLRDVAGTTSAGGLHVTPLAIYRVIPAKP